MYDRYACWCEETSKSKVAAIVIANKNSVQLTSQILELKGLVAVLSAEVADLAGQIAENEEAQKGATAVREKEHGAYAAEKADLDNAIGALQQAITVLSGAGTKTGLLQDSSAESEAMQRQAVAVVRSVVRTLPARAILAPKQMAAIQSFANQSFTSFEPTSATGATSSASATIQGILKDMYDSFTGDLESQTQEESGKQRDFEDLIATLVKEVNTMNEVILQKEGEKADAASKLADSMQELDDIQKQMKADMAFFDIMKAGCYSKHEEWTARSEARMEELKGIKKALEILTSDEARELFARSIKPGAETSFLQVSSDSAHTAAKAYNVLKEMAKKAHSLRLAALAATVRSSGVGHFDKVIEEIDKIIKDLKDEEADDIKQRDWCKTEYHENSEQKSEIKWHIKRNEAAIVKMEEIIQRLIENIEDTEKDDFKVAKKDDEAAIGLLEKTVDILSAYYKKNKIKMIQEPEFAVSKDQAPDATFSDKGARKNQSKGIVSIITMLIEDLQAEVKNGVKDESAAQMEYEKSMDAAKKLVEDLTAKKENLNSDKAKTEQEKDDEQEKLDNNNEKLEVNEEYRKSITPDCDWMLNSFEERRGKRKAEMEGLVTAKEYLAGGTPSMMLETEQVMGPTFDDDKLQDIDFLGVSFLQQHKTQ